MTDPVLDPGVGTVAGFQEGKLHARLLGGVGRDRLVAPPVTLFEQGELRTWVGAFASLAGVHTCAGTRLIASRIFSVTAYPTLYSRRRPRTWPRSVSQSRRSCDAPAPSHRTRRSLRYFAGIWAIAWARIVMWSAAVFDPALPVRSMPARNSSVLSHHTPRGWNPKVFLKVGEACSFSECAITIVASTSSTTVSPRSVPATFEAGRPSWLAARSAQTWRRVRARAAAIFLT